MPSRTTAISASWRTLMPERRRRLSGSSITPARAIRSARCTKAPRRWIGWSRSRSAASLLRRPRPPRSGTKSGSTSLTRPATSTSPSKMSEAACELDDDATTAYLEGKMPDEATIKKLIRKAVITGAFFPVLCGSAFKNKGVQPLLDAVVDYLPSPLDVPPIHGINPDNGEDVIREPKDNAPLALLAFKIMDDPFVVTITFCRIYSGTLTSGTGVINSTKERKERIGRMLLMHANNREDIKEAYAGDIVALAC